MPDGSQQPPDPAAQRAEQQMRDWKEQHRDGGGGWLGNVIDSVGDMLAAAEAGAFAVSPDTGQAIIKQLTEVQDQVAKMLRTGAMGSMRQDLGGGYATNIATFNRQVTNEGMDTTLVQFAQELEQLKSAVGRSIGNYVDTDGGARSQVDRSGGGL